MYDQITGRLAKTALTFVIGFFSGAIAYNELIEKPKIKKRRDANRRQHLARHGVPNPN